MCESLASKWETFTHQGTAAVNVPCMSDWQCVFNRLGAVTQVTGMFRLEKIYWLDGRLSPRGKLKDVKSQPVQKLCASGVGRGYLASVVTTSNHQSTQHLLALVGSLHWSTKLVRSRSIFAAAVPRCSRAVTWSSGCSGPNSKPVCNFVVRITPWSDGNWTFFLPTPLPLLGLAFRKAHSLNFWRRRGMLGQCNQAIGRNIKFSHPLGHSVAA